MKRVRPSRLSRRALLCAVGIATAHVASPFAQADDAGPGAVVGEASALAMLALKEPAKAAALKGLIHPDLWAAIRKELDAKDDAAVVANVAETLTHGGTLVAIEVLKTVVKGDVATVTARTRFKDGTVDEADETTLVRLKGRWLIEY